MKRLRSETSVLQEQRRLAESNRWLSPQDLDHASNPLALDCLKPLRKAGRHAYTVAASGCWLWNGTLNSRGYAVRGTKDERYLVHRRVMEETTGVEIPAGIQVHHICETKSCVNPLHLLALAQVDHSREHFGPSLRERAIGEVKARGRINGADLPDIAANLETSIDTVRSMLHRAASRGELVRLERGVYGVPG